MNQDGFQTVFQNMTKLERLQLEIEKTENLMQEAWAKGNMLEAEQYRLDWIYLKNKKESYDK